MIRRFLVPAVFVDKDDTVVRDVPYSASPNDISWTDGAIDGLVRLQAAHYALVMVTNQSGIAQGLLTETDVRSYLSTLAKRLSDQGVSLAAALYCPHHPEGDVAAYRLDCDCRKPGPGLLRCAAALLKLDLRRSWMVGDLLDDVEAGSRAGCRTVLVAVHDDQVPPTGGPRRPDAVAGSFRSAAEHILSTRAGA